MAMRWSIRILVIALFVAITLADTEACTCAFGDGPACQEAWRESVDAILLGRVEKIEALHTMTWEQIAWFRAGSALNAGSPIDLATGGTASFADATLAPGDTQAKPGKDNR